MTAATPAARWQDLAACRGADTDRFFPISYQGRSGADVDFAVGICKSCPVRQPCLTYALSTPQAYGIWGGTTEEERKRLPRRMRLPASAAEQP